MSSMYLWYTKDHNTSVYREVDYDALCTTVWFQCNMVCVCPKTDTPLLSPIGKLWSVCGELHLTCNTNPTMHQPQMPQCTIL